MGQSNVRVPVALSSDPEDVTVALEAAATLWDNGDQKEALRWLGRAAEAAGAAGDDLRAVAIQSAAADLRDIAAAKPQAPSATRSQTPPPPPVRSSGPIARQSSRPPPAMSPPPPPTSALNRPLISKPPPPPSARRQAPPPLPPEPVSAPPPVAVARRSFPPPLPPVAELASPPPPPAAARRSTPPPPVFEPASPPPPVAASRPPPVSVSNYSASSAALPSDSRLRVSVKSSVRDPNLFLVRVLPAGKGAPPGSQEAFLTPTEPSADLWREPGRAIRHG
jgi:hypothetical protein